VYLLNLPIVSSGCDRLIVFTLPNFGERIVIFFSHLLALLSKEARVVFDAVTTTSGMN
jgi:hypothetical protein